MTLNAGDSLTGGSGNNLLELIGSGSFDITQLAQFTGFQRIQLNNVTNSYATLVLNNQPVEVDATGYLAIFVNSQSNWNGSDIIKGNTSQQGWTQLSFYTSSYGTPVTYDLTSSTLSHIGSISGGGYTTLLINNSVTAAVQNFYGSSNDRLVTSGATLDLSQTRISGFSVVSTNGLGTTFTVGDLGSAFQIAGGVGNDTLVAQSFTFTPDQRTTIFATSSIETIIDPSGTYTATRDRGLWIDQPGSGRKQLLSVSGRRLIGTHPEIHGWHNAGRGRSNRQLGADRGRADGDRLSGRLETVGCDQYTGGTPTRAAPTSRVPSASCRDRAQRWKRSN
jgi:hypothetical protein